MVGGSAGEAAAVSVVTQGAAAVGAVPAVAAAGGARPAETTVAGGTGSAAGSAAGGAVTLLLSMKVLLREIKAEQGKSRGTRDALQRSMLC